MSDRDNPKCSYCNGTGMIACRSRDAQYAFAGPVPDDARGYFDADCWYCDCGSPLAAVAECEMSEAKHTLGPWVSSKFGFQVLTGDSWSTICVLKGSAGWEDGRGAYEPEYEWQNQEANARLIAAAPDLLAALKTVVAQIEDYERVNNLAPNPGRKHCWDSVAKARAIIAKAEGVVIADHRTEAKS